MLRVLLQWRNGNWVSSNRNRFSAGWLFASQPYRVQWPPFILMTMLGKWAGFELNQGLRRTECRKKNPMRIKCKLAELVPDPSRDKLNQNAAQKSPHSRFQIRT